jgi:hypothetical protein
MSLLIPTRALLPGDITARPSNIPHRISGVTLADGQPVSRRVIVLRRADHAYVMSASSSDADGSFDMTGLPPQQLSDPYSVICYDDSTTEFDNAQIFDRVYQVDDAGNPPQT